MSNKPRKIDRAQLGAWGELLVQRDLLIEGLDSARGTTDKGIDLFAFSNKPLLRFTVQVKTRTPRGKAGNVYSWGVRNGKETEADLFALVMRDEHEDGEADLRWYLSREQFRAAATPSGDFLRIHFVKGKTEHSFSKFKGQDGLKRFISSLRPAAIAKGVGRG